MVFRYCTVAVPSSETPRLPGPASEERRQIVFYLSNRSTRIELTEDEYAELKEYLEWLRKQNDDDLALVQAVRNAITTNQGCTTPAENFIVRILRMYVSLGGKMRPRDAEIDLEQFHEEFETLIESTQYVVQRYPDILKTELQNA